MCKKLGVTALVIVAALFVLHKTDTLGYLTTWAKKARNHVSSSIPLDMKIARLRDEIDKLKPETDKARSAIAREMVEIGKLKANLADSKANLAKKEGQLKDLRAEVEKGSVLIDINGQKIPREKVEASLARQWESFKQAREAVKSQEELLKSREESLEVAQAKLAAMQSKQEEMLAKVEKMELELRKVRLAQTQNNIAVDDSQLATVLKLADEIDTQIKTEQTELALQKAADTDTAVQQALERKGKTETALKEMDDFFGGAKVSKKD
jgi:hypothetical protein